MMLPLKATNNDWWVCSQTAYWFLLSILLFLFTDTLFHSQCVRCLRIKLFRWQKPHNLQGALTGFCRVSFRTCYQKLSDVRAPFVWHANVWGYFPSTTSKTLMIINQPDTTETVISLGVCCFDLIVFYAKQEPSNCPSRKNIPGLQNFPVAQWHMRALNYILRQLFCSFCSF